MRFSSRYLCFDEAEPMGRRRALLWPVLVWHVIYPTPVRSALNIFQKTILRLARSGCVSSKDQALMMGLSSDLVAFIAEKELGAQQLLDSSGRPHPKESQRFKATRMQTRTSGSGTCSRTRSRAP